METWIVQFMAIIKMLLWTFVYKIIFGMFSFCCGRLLRVELLGHVISLFHFFWRNFPTDFQLGYISLCFYQQCVGVIVSLQLFWNLVWSEFLIIVIFIGM